MNVTEQKRGFSFSLMRVSDQDYRYVKIRIFDLPNGDEIFIDYLTYAAMILLNFLL